MASPAYVIGKGEMLLITVKWDEGDVYALETQVRCYTHEEIQDLIDSTVNDRCSVIAVDRYDMSRRVGEDISEPAGSFKGFDIRTQEERDEETSALESVPYRDPNAEYRTHNFAQTGVAGGYGR